MQHNNTINNNTINDNLIAEQAPEDTFGATQKVLIIAYYFPPIGLSGVQRTLKFVKYLPEFNWQPIVLTTGATSYYAFDNSLLNDLEDKDISIYRAEQSRGLFAGKSKKGKATENKVRLYPSALKQKLGRFFLQSLFIPDSRIKWKKTALKTADKIFAEHPDISLIFATAPPFTDFLIAQELSAKYNIPFVVDYRDLWTDNPQYFFPTPYHTYKHSLLEFEVLRNSHKVIVITRTMKEKLLARYKFLAYQDVCIIPHGYDAEDFDFTNIYSNKHTNKKLIISHCGLFPDDRTPKHFLKAVAKFLKAMPEAKNKIELRFVGIMRKKHVKLIKRYKLDAISVLTGYLPHLEAVRHIKESDVLWMMIYNSIETPGRLFEYIGSQKPLLLLLPEGDLRQIGQEYKAAFISAPKNTANITQNLHKIYNLWKENKLPKPDEDYANSFNRRNLTALLAKELSFSTFVE